MEKRTKTALGILACVTALLGGAVYKVRSTPRPVEDVPEDETPTPVNTPPLGKAEAKRKTKAGKTQNKLEKSATARRAHLRREKKRERQARAKQAKLNKR